MKPPIFLLSIVWPVIAAASENWPQWRGSDGQGHTGSKGLPTEWGEGKNIVWKTELPGRGWSSPVIDGDQIFVGDSGGRVTCLEAKTGELVWSERIANGKYWAAPLHADGKIYFHGEEGVTTVLQAGREFKVLAESELDGKLMASAAVSGDALFLRTDKALYRIGSK